MRRSVCVLALTWLAAAALAAGDPPFHPDIPRAWDDQAVATMELPLAQRDRSPRYMTSAEYYALKVRPIYRSYPMYAPGREPVGYLESLRQKDPEIIFDASRLRTKADWIQAGKLVFESETLFRPPAAAPTPPDPRCPVASDGTLNCFVAGLRYYIRKKGVLEVGSNSCAGCHTRVLSDGSMFEGGQGLPRFSASPATLSGIRDSTPAVFQE